MKTSQESKVKATQQRDQQFRMSTRVVSDTPVRINVEERTVSTQRQYDDDAAFTTLRGKEDTVTIRDAEFTVHGGSSAVPLMAAYGSSFNGEASLSDGFVLYDLDDALAKAAARQ